MPTLSQCCLCAHIGNCVVDNCDALCHVLEVRGVLKSLDAVKNGLHGNDLLSELGSEQRVVANVGPNVEQLPTYILIGIM